VGVELFHADRQADERIGTTKLIVAFRNFAKALKKQVAFTASSSLKTKSMCEIFTPA
jgi:hypothetical protein